MALPEYDRTYERPNISRTEDHGTYTVRLRANSAYTQKEGWHGKDITVEYTGPPEALPANLFRDRTVDLHQELTEACHRLNDMEGRH